MAAIQLEPHRQAAYPLNMTFELIRCPFAKTHIAKNHWNLKAPKVQQSNPKCWLPLLSTHGEEFHLDLRECISRPELISRAPGDYTSMTMKHHPPPRKKKKPKRNLHASWFHLISPVFSYHYLPFAICSKENADHPKLGS